MIELSAIRLEMDILLFSSVLYPNPSPELKFVDAEIQYGSSKKIRKKISFLHVSRSHAR